MKHAGEKTKKHIYSRTSKRNLKTKKTKLEHIVALRQRKAPYNEEATQFTLEYFILLQDFSHYFLL